MKLFWSTSSPFARKARVVLREKNLLAAVQEIECNPFADPVELRAVNPLGKIPTLVLPSGEALYDSPVICAYLDSLNSSPGLIPEGPAQWNVRRAEALADGLLDLAVGLTLELRRPKTEQSPTTIERWRRAGVAAAGEMELTLSSLPADVTLGHVAFACACGYLDFRPASVEFRWRDTLPRLAQWYETFALRASMIDTRPDDGSYQRFAPPAQ